MPRPSFPRKRSALLGSRVVGVRIPNRVLAKADRAGRRLRLTRNGLIVAALEEKLDCQRHKAA